jgi:hypothetical protein
VSEDAIAVGFVHNGKEVAYSWHRSFVELLGYDMTHGGHIIRGGWHAQRHGHDITQSRNKAIAGWLDSKDHQHCDWFFWIDTDMGFAPDTVERLLAIADPETRPIIGGLCFSNSEADEDGMGGHYCEPRPTLFKWVPNMGTVLVADYMVNALVPVAATGSACILIHRSVFEKIRSEYGDVWYDQIPNPYVGGFHSEDISFCLRAAALGMNTNVHTGVRTTHLKHHWVSERDYWESRIAPPAEERCAVIVPVMKRPQNAQPFMTSLRASTGLATVYAVVDPDDSETYTAWLEAGAEVILAERDKSSFPQKANLGCSKTSEPWLLFVGDDVTFHPGWLDHAEWAGNLHNKDVVATNDLSNPRVLNGSHATHPLIRRSYIDEQGASWDGPGTVCHEGYRHNFCDDEWTYVARSRSAFAAALGSVVEHLHPLFGKTEDDVVYRKGKAHFDQDRRLFERRLRDNTK